MFNDWIKMPLRSLVLAFVGVSAGGIVAAGVFAFLAIIGVFPRLIGKTHTSSHIWLYETIIILGGILGNIFFLYGIRIPFGGWLLPVFGLFGGIFVGCWSMALAEILDVFPIFVRRVKLLRGIKYVILGVALGKGIGAFVFFFNRF